MKHVYTNVGLKLRLGEQDQSHQLINNWMTIQRLHPSLICRSSSCLNFISLDPKTSFNYHWVCASYSLYTSQHLDQQQPEIQDRSNHLISGTPLPNLKILFPLVARLPFCLMTTFSRLSASADNDIDSLLRDVTASRSPSGTVSAPSSSTGESLLTGGV